MVIYEFTAWCEEEKETKLMANASVASNILVMWSNTQRDSTHCFNISLNDTVMEATVFIFSTASFSSLVGIFIFPCNCLALDANCHAVSSLLQGSSMQLRRRTGRPPTPTSLRPSRATTPSTAPEPSQHSNTCYCAKLCSTCE